MKHLIVQTEIGKHQAAEDGTVNWTMAPGYHDGSTVFISADRFAGAAYRQSLSLDINIPSTHLVHEVKQTFHNCLPTFKSLMGHPCYLEDS